MGKDKNPTVSVIIPTYNRAHLIGRAIRSVLNQTYQDFEIIVVDDGSTDNTEEVVKGFNDGRIRYIRHDENRGGAAARNTGIKAARGEYIAFLDSDDEWLARKLEKQIALFEKLDPRFGVVYCRWYVMDDDTGFVRQDSHTTYRGNVWHRVLEGWGVPIQSALMRQECFECCGGFDESLPSHQDAELWLRIAQHYHFDLVDKSLVVIHFHQGYQITTDSRSGMRGLELLLEKWGPTIREEIGEEAYETLRRKRLSSVYVRAVMGNLRASQRGLAWKNFTKLLATHHVSPKIFIKLLIALIGGLSIHDQIRTVWRRMRWNSVPLEELYDSQAKILNRRCDL